jgi:NAD(P)-dependent dehydrogenase (short-subunit alcohol dehydrogenase family)
MTTTLPETFATILPLEKEPADSPEKTPATPVAEEEQYVGSGKLRGKVAIVTGGDSGIGRAVAILFAREGADVSIVYFNEHEDADKTMLQIEELERRAIKFAGDIAEPDFCAEVIQRTINAFGRLDILVNNAGEQYEVKGVEDLEPARVEKCFRANVFGFFYLTKAALPHLKAGATIINTTSLQAYDPSPHLMVYAGAKAAILNFTRSLAKQLAEKKIRVNAVAPGPVWTAPATFSPGDAGTLGEKTLFKRPGQPAEVAPAYLFLATEAESSLITGQVLHVNGGQGMFS